MLKIIVEILVVKICFLCDGYDMLIYDMLFNGYVKYIFG